MNTLFGVCNLRTVKRVSMIAALALALTACGGGGKVIPSVPLDQLVESLFAQFDAGTLSEESLIAQLKALGF